MLDQVNQTTYAVIGFLTALTLIAGAYRVLWLGKRDKQGLRTPGVFKRLLLDARAIRDTLVGREPVRDSITGEVKLPAVPSIGQRMASEEQARERMEQQMTLLTNAVSDMANQDVRIAHIEQSQTDIQRRLDRIESGAFLERLATKAESIQLLQTMETAIGAEPPEGAES